MNADGSDQRLLTTGKDFEWSPDGTRIAFHRPSFGEDDDVWVVARDGSNLLRLVRNKSRGELTWSPDGRQIAFSGSYRVDEAAIYIVNSDGTGLARLTSPRRYTDDILPDWSPDGARIAFERDRYDVSEQGNNTRFLIISMNPDGTDQRVLTRQLNVEWPVWSGDGSKIACHMGERIDGQRDICVVNRDGSGQQNLTNTRSPSEYDPRWSPDSRKILFESRSGRNLDVHVINVDGRRHLRLAPSRHYDAQPNWSPDGKSIVFVSRRDGNRDIYVMSATGRNLTNLTNSAAGTVNANPEWSPTG